MLKEATPTGCCSHGFWAPGTQVGWGRGADRARGGVREAKGRENFVHLLLHWGLSGRLTQPCSSQPVSWPADLCAHAALRAQSGESGTHCPWSREEGLLWIQQALGGWDLLPSPVPLTGLEHQESWVLAELTSYFPRARYPSWPMWKPCLGLFVPAWLAVGQGVGEGWLPWNLGSSF